MGAVAGFIEMILGILLPLIWGQLQKEDTVDEIEGTLDAVDLIDDPDDLDLWLPNPNAGALGEGDPLT